MAPARTNDARDEFPAKDLLSSCISQDMQDAQKLGDSHATQTAHQTAVPAVNLDSPQTEALYGDMSYKPYPRDNYAPRSPSLQTPSAVIFDLGDVLFNWSADTTTTIPARKLRDILTTPIWYSYDRGEITREVCYEMSAQQFALSASEIAEAFSQARESLEPNHAVVTFIRELRKDSTVKVYAMSNVGKEDFEELEKKMDGSLFDRVFTSAAAGIRKPDLGFYRSVLEEIGLAGNKTVFVDDKKENVRAARAFGIRGIVFDDSTIQALRSIFYTPEAKAWRYLKQNAMHCDSITNNGLSFGDNFAKLLVADFLRDPNLIDLSWGSKNSWNFFTGPAAHVPGGRFSDDLDTTSLALMALPISNANAYAILATMAEYVNEDGTFQTYYDREKPRIDPVVSANILACFYAYGRGHEFERTLKLVESFLLERSYMPGGTRYYHSPDCCLGFIGRLLRSHNDYQLHTTLGPLLKSRVRERLGMEGSALDLAFRVITSSMFGLDCEKDRVTLLSLQWEDGGWGAGWMYQYGQTGVKVGNRAATTAIAIAALACGIHE